MNSTTPVPLSQQAGDLVRRAAYLAIERKGPCVRNNIAGKCPCDNCARIGEMVRAGDAVTAGIRELEDQATADRA